MDLSGRTAAITGGGGFIGLALAARLRRLGARVRGLDLSPKAAGSLAAIGAEALIGDVTSREDARRLCDAADVVIHTAAIVSEGGDPAPFRRVNVEGVRTIAEAARDAGARRLVHLSSVMVYGFDFPHDVTEDGPLRGEGNPYCETKIESERVVLDLHARGDLEVTVIRPGDVYGPGSIPWVVRPLELMKRRLFVVPERGVINQVYVDDLVDGIVRAIERDAVGEAFNLTEGVATPCADYFARLARMIGRDRPPVVPARVLRPLFSAIERGCEALRVEPPARAAALSFLARPNRYSIEKARRVLGFAPRVDLDEGMRRVERWLLETRPL